MRKFPPTIEMQRGSHSRSRYVLRCAICIRNGVLLKVCNFIFLLVVVFAPQVCGQQKMQFDYRCHSHGMQAVGMHLIQLHFTLNWFGLVWFSLVRFGYTLNVQNVKKHKENQWTNNEMHGHLPFTDLPAFDLLRVFRPFRCHVERTLQCNIFFFHSPRKSCFPPCFTSNIGIEQPLSAKGILPWLSAT